MRSAVACIAALVLAGAAVFLWQRSEIVHLRSQVARQGDALADLSLRVGVEPRASPVSLRAAKPGDRLRASPSDQDGSAEMRADERRVIVDEYRDVLAQMNLPSETSARLLDLLTERIETVLDAQDAAVREGFAEGSAQMARAVSLAIADVDRDIVGLVGQEGIRRIDGLSGTETSAPLPVPTQPAAPVYVTVVVEAPAAQASYDAASPPSVDADAGVPYVSYPYPYFPLYPMAAVLNGSRGSHRFGGPRSGEPPHLRESVRLTYR